MAGYQVVFRSRRELTKLHKLAESGPKTMTETQIASTTTRLRRGVRTTSESALVGVLRTWRDQSASMLLRMAPRNTIGELACRDWAALFGSPKPKINAH